MSPRRPVIAIDGPSGVGKSTVARLVAEKLGFTYVDTGAMYRAAALAADSAGTDPEDDGEISAFLKGSELRVEGDSVLFDGRDVTEEIREQRAGELASVYSARRPVREFLVAVQRRLAEGGGVVMEGRDIGTVVAPDAEVKVFLDAENGVRARRRHAQLTAGGKGLDLREVEEELAERDRRDSSRAHSPLEPAPDAVVMDTSGVTAEEVAQRILALARERTGFGDTHS